MHDPVYRVAISSQNSSYNQPPHPGFYVASDMDFPPPVPNIEFVAAKLDRGSNNFIKNLTLHDLANAFSWELRHNYQLTDNIYGDSNYKLNTAPDILLGKDWIQTSLASRYFPAPGTLAEFALTADADLYILHQKSIASKPEWLDEWTLLDETASVRIALLNFPMNIYTKSFKAGTTVKLGANTNNGSISQFMYFLVADGGVLNSIYSPAGLQDNGLKVTPNPVRGTATVDISLAQDQQIDISLYNINGQLVKTIDRGRRSAGTYSTTFDTAPFAPGLYILRMFTDYRIIQQKVVIQ